MFGKAAHHNRPPDTGGPASPDPIEDQLNRDIIAFLEEDGRTSFSVIAQALNVSEGTVRNRVARLKASGALRIVAVVDPAATEYHTSAMLNLRMAPGCSPAKVAERLDPHSCVVYILWVAGRCDLVVEVVVEDQAQFLTFLETHIHQAADIAHAEVMPGLRNFKNQFLLKRGHPETSEHPRQGRTQNLRNPE
ncbi:Lrp/AsnC family transcriptional regulator, regulator for asnA, asnC and gidA [Roseovarius tolerans]|uniref:Lrp/AsnC family transcriptional regulator, regulator for asnA, asnC and gidA n=1 Tax=Roseovarius tolerans TaxID=74031 RepID=A0A1H8IF59_9RHOB|nr:Lrp/AsnC family transcriptional regulator [Roseovarius tolerans]SEN66905.1 Lrp/AsnC family transcriptional regulator, regulator for asnA, asnC and gidA [Roseovarius tolerans]